MSALLLSDKRAKKKIRKVGMTASGIPVKEFEYKTGRARPPRYRGVIVQDVEKIAPRAVFTLGSRRRPWRRYRLDCERQEAIDIVTKDKIPIYEGFMTLESGVESWCTCASSLGLPLPEGVGKE